jgi:hypothetical protein
MNKSIILAVLLAPSFCLAKTEEYRLKEARQMEIIKEVQNLEAQVLYIADIIKYNYWVVFFNGESLRKQLIDARDKVVELNKEYYQLEEEKHVK